MFSRKFIILLVFAPKKFCYCMYNMLNKYIERLEKNTVCKKDDDTCATGLVGFFSARSYWLGWLVGLRLLAATAPSIRMLRTPRYRAHHVACLISRYHLLPNI